MMVAEVSIMNIRLICMTGIACAISQAANADVATVAADRVNLRAQPARNSEVMGQCNAGLELTVVSTRDEWVEVLIPENVDVYAHKDFVKDGVVTASPLNLRAGPGINYSRVGTVAKGEPVTVRGEFGDWFKIAPPRTATAWVSVELLNMPRFAVAPGESGKTAFVPAPPQAPALTPAAGPARSGAVLEGPTRAPGSEPSIARQPLAAPELAEGAVPPDDLRLAPVARQGALVVREGRIHSPPFQFGRPSRFHLYVGPEANARLACYVRGNRAQLTELMGRPLRIQGREYWVQGSDHPVVVVEQIMLIEGPDATN